MRSRFLVDGPIVTGARIELSGDEMHHAARVLRVRTGEAVEVFDGRGSGADAVVSDVGRDRVEIEIRSPLASREAPIGIVLASALIAPDLYELVLQKGCELGVTRFVPVVSERVETKVDRVRGKAERWRRILLEATKQCGRTVLPALEEPRRFDDVIASETGLVVFDADAEPGPWPGPPLDTITLVVGPEGGLSPEEIARARHAGAVVCSLGPRRLRAETASIAAVSLAGSLLGDLMPRRTSS